MERIYAKVLAFVSAQLNKEQIREVNPFKNSSYNNDEQCGITVLANHWLITVTVHRKYLAGEKFGKPCR